MSKKTLKELIKAAGYTYRSLAEKMGIGHDAILAWGKGDRVPRLDNAIALAAELGVPLKTLSAALGHDVSRIPDDREGLLPVDLLKLTRELQVSLKSLTVALGEDPDEISDDLEEEEDDRSKDSI